MSCTLSCTSSQIANTRELGGCTRISCIHDNIAGYDLLDLEEESYNNNAIDVSDELLDVPESKVVEQLSFGDMQRAMSTMTSLFPASARPSGNESEPFCFKLKPILEQMESLSIPMKARPPILYGLLTGKARDVASRISFAGRDLQFLIDSIKREVLFDPDIQDRLMTRWNTTEYQEFRAQESNDETATRASINFLRQHQLDLPSHMHSDPMLLERIRAVFRFVPFCSNLFQQSSAGETAHSFGSKLISAAANSDLRAKKAENNYGKTLTVSPNGRKSVHLCHSDTPSDFTLTAFFSKTPPPPRHKRPFRYSRRNFRRNFRQQYNRHRRPRLFMKDKKLCFGCRQEGHFLRDCPQRRYHQQRLTHLVDIGHGAAYILENDAEPCNDSHSEILDFVDTAFAGNEDDAHDEFDEWICTVWTSLTTDTHLIANSHIIKTPTSSSCLWMTLTT